MSSEAKTGSGTEPKNPSFLWALFIILSGILFLVVSVKVAKDSAHERILSGVGDGLLILGLIDLILRGYLQRITNRLSPNERLLKFYQEVDDMLGATVKGLEEVNQNVDAIILRGDVKTVIIEVESISSKLESIEEQIRTIEHVLDPKAKASYEEVMRTIEEDRKNQQA